MTRFLPFLMLILGLAGCNKLRNWKYNPPNVLLISVEGLSRALPCYGDTTFQTPNIDRLAMRSVIFEEAFAQHPTAPLALTSIFTGLYPRMAVAQAGGGVYESSIFPALESGDYRIAFLGLAATYQDAEAPVAISRYTELTESERFRAIDNPAVTEQAISLWDEYEGEPFFVNTHYRMNAVQSSSPKAVYQSALTEVDQEIGRLLDELMSRQEASNTIVLLLGLNPMAVAYPINNRAHFMPSYVKVPMLYYDFEHDSSRRVADLTELRSLYPTLGDRCLEAGQKIQACNAPSLSQILNGRFREIPYSETGLSNDRHYFAAYTSGFFYLSELEGEEGLFSLSPPPPEQLPGDAVLMDSLKYIFRQKYKLSAMD